MTDLQNAIKKDKAMTDIKEDIRHDVIQQRIPNGNMYTNDDVRIVNEWSKTRQGFKHTAHLYIGDREIGEAKSTYQNRTWESYEFETVMMKLRDTYENKLTEVQKAKVNAIIRQGR
jgi:hypothetical protein